MTTHFRELNSPGQFCQLCQTCQTCLTCLTELAFTPLRSLDLFTILGYHIFRFILKFVKSCSRWKNNITVFTVADCVQNYLTACSERIYIVFQILNCNVCARHFGSAGHIVCKYFSEKLYHLIQQELYAQSCKLPLTKRSNNCQKSTFCLNALMRGTCLFLI